MNFFDFFLTSEENEYVPRIFKENDLHHCVDGGIQVIVQWLYCVIDGDRERPPLDPDQV